MIKNALKSLILLTSLGMSCYAGECKSQPDVCMWNEAMAATKVYSDAEQEFSVKAQAFRAARQAELETPGSVSVDVVKTSTAMWIAWQQLRAAWRAMDKAMHDFWVVEMNK